MALFPVRHPQKDFFILDISDVVPKDDTASMEHPIFSLATRPDMRHLVYENKSNRLEITPSGLGLPTIFDKDILIFCISQLMHKRNNGEKIGKRLRFSARELSIATNRPIGGNHYKRLEMAFRRLQGTQFVTDIKTGDKIETRIFSLIDAGGFVRKDDGSWRLDYCEIVLSDWFMKAIETSEVVSISGKYFRLRRPLERRIYEIARKHCGKQNKWQIGLKTLQNKTGSNAPFKRFRFNLKQIIKEDNTPDYRLELTQDDLVIVRPRRKPKANISDYSIPERAEKKAREIAIEKGWDYYALEHDFQDFAKAKAEAGDPVKNIGGAFIGFCNHKETLR